MNNALLFREIDETAFTSQLNRKRVNIEESRAVVRAFADVDPNEMFMIFEGHDWDSLLIARNTSQM